MAVMVNAFDRRMGSVINDRACLFVVLVGCKSSERFDDRQDLFHESENREPQRGQFLTFNF